MKISKTRKIPEVVLYRDTPKYKKVMKAIEKLERIF